MGRIIAIMALAMLAAATAAAVTVTAEAEAGPTHAREYPRLGVVVETVADGLSVPWGVDWAGDTMLFTERGGRLMAMQDGRLLPEPLLTLGAGGMGEGGMLGVAVDPDFAENRHVYLYYTYSHMFSTMNKVVRYQLADDSRTVTEEMVLIDGIPGAAYHDGGRIKFGPDQRLYVTTGDAGDPYSAQDPGSLAGKILRINPDGTIPADNPWEGSPVYSMGHRNPQGIGWDARGNMVITEHGPSGWRGTAHDEINLVAAGANYGWPDIIGGESADGMLAPILHTGTDTWAPSGATFYHGDRIPQWTGKYFVATLRGAHLHMIDFDLHSGAVLSHEGLFQDEFGRLRDVATGPDGLLYVLTSNMDGRGASPLPPSQAGGDKILRISPMAGAGGGAAAAGHADQGASQDTRRSAADRLCGGVSADNPVHLATHLRGHGGGGVDDGGDDDGDSTVRILAEGCVYGGDGASMPGEITITIRDPRNGTVAEETLTPGGGGTFSREFVLDAGASAVNGTYLVTVTGDGAYLASDAFVIPEFGAAALAALAVGLLLTYAAVGLRARPGARAPVISGRQ